MDSLAAGARLLPRPPDCENRRDLFGLPQRCAGHDTGAPLAEKHLPQCRGDIDRCGIER